MFTVARRALMTVAKVSNDYASVAQDKNKFCRGYGIFQYDLQHFKKNPSYFLNQGWHSFEKCVGIAVEELRAAQARQRWGRKKTLTYDQLVHVAIAYNRGSSRVSKGFKQGFRPRGGKYYGEMIDEYYRTAQSIHVGQPVIEAIPSPELEPVAGELYRVYVDSYLSLRAREDERSKRLARLPPGQIVVRRPGGASRWWMVEADVRGTLVRGFVASEYLRPIATVPEETSRVVAPTDFRAVPKYILAEVGARKRTLKSGARGMDAKRVQEWLCFHDCSTGIDSDFGSATKRSVRKFQARSGLRVTGDVDAKTWDALVAPMKKALAEPAKIVSGSLSDAVRRVAEQHVKVRPFEIGGQNLGPWVRLYCKGEDGKEWLWCAGFVSTLLHQACFYRGEQLPIEGSVSCDWLAAQAKAAGLFVRYEDIVSGAVDWSALGACSLFLRRKSPGDWNHTGIALDASGSGRRISFETIEGNTDSEGGWNGGEVRRRTRSFGRQYDFVKLG